MFGCDIEAEEEQSGQLKSESFLWDFYETFFKLDNMNVLTSVQFYSEYSKLR